MSAKNHDQSNERLELLEMFNKHIDFVRWGFKLDNSSEFPQSLPCIVYQSDQCKIRLRWEQDRPYEPRALYINYGRLHAPINKSKMLWNEEECYCWHEIGKALNFLDGLSPFDTTNREFRLPRIMRAFSEAERVQRQGEESIIKINSFIWDHYGQRLFDLFDLRRPDLWNEYRRFLKHYYEHLDEQHKRQGIPPSPVRPPLYNIC